MGNWVVVYEVIILIIGNHILDGYVINPVLKLRKTVRQDQSMNSEPNKPVWDPLLGVWANDYTPTTITSLPKPLYIFGYGSLIWRPGDILERFPSFPCICSGWSRRFAQRSMDHRGDPMFPGLVATMIEDSFLNTEVPAHSEDKKNECVGVVYLVDDEMAEFVIQELDFRERGGYTRHSTNISLLCNTPFHMNGDIAEALVYTGSTSNPNFFLHEQTLSSAAIISVAKGPSGYNTEYLFQLCESIRQLPCQTQDRYLIELEKEVRFLKGRQSYALQSLRNRWITDKHIRDASESISITSISNSDQFHNLIQDFLQFSKADDELTSPSSEPHIHSEHDLDNNIQKRLLGRLESYRVLGWGSNELGQVSPFLDPMESVHALEFLSVPVDKGTSLLDETLTVPIYQIACGGRHTGLLLHHWLGVPHPDTTLPRPSRSRLFLWGHLASISSATRITSEATTTSSDAVGLASARAVDDVLTFTCGFAHVLMVDGDGQILSCGEDLYGQSSGRITSTSSRPHPGFLPDNPLLTRSLSSQTTGVTQRLRIESCKTEEGFRLRFFDSLTQRLYPQKISAGLRHSAALLDGWLVTWGEGRHGQTLPIVQSVQSPSSIVDHGREVGMGGDGCSIDYSETASEERTDSHWIDTLAWRPCDAMLVDIGCGSRHTVVIDDRGRVWTLGSNKYGQLGRPSPSSQPPLKPDTETVSNDDSLRKGSLEKDFIMGDSLVIDQVVGLRSDIRWSKVTCGWSHTVVRGVSTNGSFVFACWGRNDLGQLGVSPQNPAVKHAVRYLPDLPKGRIREVCCAGESTFCASEDGCLWAMGWEDHNNLGTKLSSDKGSPQESAGSGFGGWRPVIDEKGLQVQLLHSWDGALGFGGGHAVALVKS